MALISDAVNLLGFIHTTRFVWGMFGYFKCKEWNQSDLLLFSPYCCAALAARAGAEHIKPALQRIYMTRATAYRDALKSFVEGYQEGVAEVMTNNTREATSQRVQKEADGQSSKSSTMKS